MVRNNDMQYTQQIYQNQGTTHRSEKKYRGFIIFLIIIIILGAFFAFLWKKYVKEGEWVCDNGEWIEKGNARTPKPEQVCMESAAQDMPKERVKPAAEFIEIDSRKSVEGIDIRVSSPHVNSTITSPLTVSGEAKGWFVDGKILVQLMDDKGNIIVQSEALAKGEGDEYVTFETKMDFDRKDVKAGDLVFQKINPSNDPAQARTFSFPIFFE